jgi:hypothetical protein
VPEGRVNPCEGLFGAPRGRGSKLAPDQPDFVGGVLQRRPPVLDGIDLDDSGVLGEGDCAPERSGREPRGLRVEQHRGLEGGVAVFVPGLQAAEERVAVGGAVGCDLRRDLPPLEMHAGEPCGECAAAGGEEAACQ